MKLKKKSGKNIMQVGCAALALTLAVGTVPFLRGVAAGGEAAVSGSDIAGNTNAVTPSADTAEPKQTLDDGSTVHTFTKL